MLNNEQWTEKQLEVLNHQTGNLLVSASAGSGKTKVLIEKVVRLIMEGKANLKDLLVVTFTNSASQEIKQRLSDSIKKSKDARLIGQLDDLSTSDISTFDSFCIKVVREFGYKIGVPNNFTVSDNALSQFLQNEALENVFNAHNKKYDANFERLLNSFFENRNTTLLKENIIRIYNFLRSNKDGEKLFSEKLEQTYCSEFENNIAIEYLNNMICQICEVFADKFEKLSLSCQMLHDKTCIESINICREQILSFNNDFYNNLHIFCQQMPILRHSKKDIAEISDIKSEYSNLKTDFKKSLSKFFGSFKDIEKGKIEEDINSTREELEYLLFVVGEFNEEYKTIKQNYGVLDFADIEQNASLVLSDKAVAESLQNRYKYIFIDEYQDTNYLQEEIVNKITTGDNLIMVGDVKQSIYRFRFTEPKIFINKYNLYKDCQTANSVIELNKNFRSEIDILEFANYVFDNIMKLSTDEVDYKSTAELEFGGNVLSQNSEPKVKVIVANSKKLEEEETDTFNFYSVKNSNTIQKNVANIQREAVLVANEIKNLLGKNIYDAKLQTNRPIQYSDIAILSRNKSKVITEIKSTLNKLNIPVISENSVNLFENFDMKLLFAMLKLINNKQDDISLLTILTSIVGGLLFDDVARIRSFDGKSEFFYQSVQNYLLNQNNEICQKIKVLFDKLDSYYIESSYKDIVELIVSIVTNENLEKYFTINGYGKQFENHYNLFLQGIESIKKYSLSKFINYVDTFAGEFNFDETIKDSENAVTISSIHASKGLEYPVVFLIATGKDFSSQSEREKILLDNDFGIAKSVSDSESRIKYDSPVVIAFKQKIMLEQKKEEMRLLYVALTRAKNFLTIIGTTDLSKQTSFASDDEIMQSKNYMQWILGTLSNEDINTLNENEHISKQLFSKSAEFQKIDLQNIDCSFTPEQEEYVENDNHIQNFEEILSHKFEHNNLAQKNTVTQIMQDTDHYNISDFSYLKNDKSGDEDFLSIGTLYHKIMQELSFNKKMSVETQIAMLIAKNKISKDDMAQIDLKKIEIAKETMSNISKDACVVLKEQQFLCNVSANKLIETQKTNKILIQGVADIIIINKEDIFLVDYKTSRLQTEQEFSKKYKIQLDIYANAIETFYQKPVSRKYIYSFYLDKLLSI